MKKSVYIFIYVSIVTFLLINWANQEITIAGNRKPRVNFFGSLQTREGNKYEVENILIGGLYKQIPLYEAPQKIPSDYVLTKNPRVGFIAKIDLSEVSKIEVPNPDVKLTHQRKGFSKNEYIEIIVTFKDQNGTQRHYLMDIRRKLQCDEINKAGPIELESLSFNALKCLTITGYRYREPEVEKDLPRA